MRHVHRLFGPCTSCHLFSPLPSSPYKHWGENTENISGFFKSPGDLNSGTVFYVTSIFPHSHLHRHSVKILIYFCLHLQNTISLGLGIKSQSWFFKKHEISFCKILFLLFVTYSIFTAFNGFSVNFQHVVIAVDVALYSRVR